MDTHPHYAPPPIAPVALITGAASGIGYATAQRLARFATGGLLLIDQNEAALTAAADSLAEPPERVSTLAFDVADEARWAQASDFIATHYGRIDWAVVNAGIAFASPIDEMAMADWRRVLAVNLDGAFLTMRAAIHAMKQSATGGAIVALASAAAAKAESGTAAYGASKAGLVQLVRVAAKEGAAHNIRVNAIAPGGVETPMWRSVPFFQELVHRLGSERAAFDEMAREAAPLGRYASADDVARLVELLLTDAGPITGAVMAIDGGYTL